MCFLLFLFYSFSARATHDARCLSIGFYLRTGAKPIWREGPTGSTPSEERATEPDSMPDKTRQDQTRPNKTRPNKTRPDPTRPPVPSRPPRGLTGAHRELHGLGLEAGQRRGAASGEGGRGLAAVPDRLFHGAVSRPRATCAACRVWNGARSGARDIRGVGPRPWQQNPKPLFWCAATCDFQASDECRIISWRSAADQQHDWRVGPITH